MFVDRNALVFQVEFRPAKPRTSVRFRSPPPHNQEFTENIGAERAPLSAWNRPKPPGKMAKPPVIWSSLPLTWVFRALDSYLCVANSQSSRKRCLKQNSAMPPPGILIKRGGVCEGGCGLCRSLPCGSGNDAILSIARSRAIGRAHASSGRGESTLRPRYAAPGWHRPTAPLDHAPGQVVAWLYDVLRGVAAGQRLVVLVLRRAGDRRRLSSDSNACARVRPLSIARLRW
jgi:hypothetical protein